VKQIIAFFIAIVLCTASMGQNSKPNPKATERDMKRQQRREKIDNLIRQQEEGSLVFNKQNVFAFRLNTDGWGMMFEKGYLKSVKVTNIFALEFGEKKHPKERRTNNIFTNGSFIQFGNPYVYGKQNIFYQLKPTIGQQRLIGGKTNKNGVAVQAIYAGGISLGIERPYYVRVDDPGPQGSRDIKYSQADSAAFLAPGNIIQGTGLRYGWNELKLIPGVHGKVAIRFDYGRFNEMVSAIEVGVNFEAYTRKINIMLLNPGEQTFFNGYVAILFGKRK
jgi:hypothetical protein